MVGAQQAMPQLPPNLPEGLANLLSCCFKQQPASRPSAAQLVYELRVSVVVVVVVLAASFPLAEQKAKGFCLARAHHVHPVDEQSNRGALPNTALLS